MTTINEKSNIKWGVILSYVSLFVSLIGTLFVTNRVLNLIGDYNYGLYSFVNSITTWLTVVSSALISSYLRFTSIEAAKNNGDVSRTNTLYFKMLCILGLLILVLGTGTIRLLYVLHVNFGGYSWDDSVLIYFLFLFSIINISITLFSTIFTQFINYKKQFIYEKLLLIFTSLLSFASHFIIAFFTKSIILIAVYSIFSTLFNLALNFLFCKKHLKIRFKKTFFSDNKPLVKSILVFSSVLVLNSVVDQISHQVDKTLLGFFSSPENVTIYEMGMQFNTYLSIVAVAVSGVFAPKIHELYANHKFDDVNSLFLKVSRIQSIIVVFIAFGFVACGYNFILWWLGPKRIYSYYCGAILMVLNVMPFSVKLSIEVQRAANKHKFRSFLYLAVAIFNVLLSILFLLILPTDYAVFACLIGTIISSVICHWIAMNFYNKKVIGLSMEKHWLQLGKQILFGILSAGIALLLATFLFSSISSNLIKFLLEGFIYVIIYSIFLLIFDRKFIFSFLKQAKE